MANSLDATVTLAPHSAPLDKANGRRRICLRDEQRTRRDARFLHVDVSMSDRTADRIEVPESRRSSRPSMRRAKRSSSLSFSPALLPPNSMLPRNDAAELDFPPKATEGGPQVSKRMRNEDISRSRLRLRGYRVEAGSVSTSRRPSLASGPSEP